MKKIALLVAVMLSSVIIVNAQTVQAPAKDSAQKYKANDRLKTAGPKDGWKDSSQLKIDTLKINNKNRMPGRQKSNKDKKIKT